MPLHSHHFRHQEATTNKIIVSAEIDATGTLVDIVYAPFGYHSVVVKVQRGRATLCRVQRWEDPDFPEDPLYELIELTPELTAEEAEQFQAWLIANIKETGGALTLPGVYPVYLPFPAWLRAKLC